MLRNTCNLIAAGMVSVGLYSALPMQVPPAGPVAILLSSSAVADVPRQINHQGVVSVNGVRFSGVGVFRFAIVNSAGQNVWTNDGTALGGTAAPTAGVSRNVANGAYSVHLGDTLVPNMMAMPETVFSLPDRVLRIWFDSQQGHGMQRLHPDQPLNSTPYAIAALHGVPAGTLVPFGGSTVPPGWLVCDGATISRTAHPALFAAIGVAWGAGDGNTTFHLPDLRGRHLRGVDFSPTLPLAGRDPNVDSRSPCAPGGNAGNAVGSIQGYATARPTTNFTTNVTGNHRHQTYMTEGHDGQGDSYAEGDDCCYQHWTSAFMREAGAHSHTVDSGGDAETRPLNAYVLYLIKS